jgi:hypothetical protein
MYRRTTDQVSEFSLFSPNAQTPKQLNKRRDRLPGKYIEGAAAAETFTGT